MVTNNIRNLLLEELGTVEENVQSVRFEVITHTGPNTGFYIQDVFIDIRGLMGVISLYQNGEGESLGHLSPLEKYDLTVKFDNSPYVDIATLVVEMNRIVGVQQATILTVDGKPFDKNLAQLDYNLARAPDSAEWWVERNRITTIPEYEKNRPRYSHQSLQYENNLVKENTVKITRRQLKTIIKEVIQGHVHGDPSKERFLDLAMSAMARSDFRRAADAIMDSYMIDDVWPEDEQMLIDMLSRSRSGSASDVEKIADTWYNQTFKRQR